MRPVTPRERKFIAVGILVAAFAAVWLGFVSPVIGGFSDRASERARLEAQYARNARLLAAIPVWQHVALAQQRTMGQFALQAATPDLAAQQLQQRLSRSINQVGGLVRNVAKIDDASPGTVEVRGDADLTMSQLYQLLKHLEGETPYVVVEYLSVAANRAFETGHLAAMDVRIQVTASFRPVQPQ